MTERSESSLPPKKRMRYRFTESPSSSNLIRSDSSFSSLSTSSRDSVTDSPTLNSEFNVEDLRQKISAEEEEVGLLMLHLRNGSITVSNNAKSNRSKAKRRRSGGPGSAKTSKRKGVGTTGDDAYLKDVGGNCMSMGYFSKYRQTSDEKEEHPDAAALPEVQAEEASAQRPKTCRNPAKLAARCMIRSWLLQKRCCTDRTFKL